MMKWIQFPLILFLLIGFPLFQCDQTIALEWLICDNSLDIKSDNNSPLDEPLGPHSKKVVPTFFVPIQFIAQLKNPLSVLHGFFQGTSPFWRPPPS
ncbi:MAG: hypothetical protein A2157_04670 [Deltaproteobacteria bacterium RBG_16_47_11]|nr:MAG: hypothetical protein A2157_04670 [Deltaproteobacteria bacterium RBG_16_47_11]